MYENDPYLRASMAEYEREVSRGLLRAEARRSARSKAGPDAGPRFTRPLAALRHLVGWTAPRRSTSHTAETR